MSTNHLNKQDDQIRVTFKPMLAFISIKLGRILARKNYQKLQRQSLRGPIIIFRQNKCCFLVVTLWIGNVHWR
jgi:hypothetical protein